MSVLSHSTCAEYFRERGDLTASGVGTAQPAMHAISSGDVELAFLGDPFESLGRAFDPVLAVIAIGRKQTDHLIGAAGGRTGDIAGSEIDGLSNGELVLQRPSPRKNAGRAYGPANFGRLKPRDNLAQRQAFWPVTSGHSKYANSAGSSVR